jgi:type VI secretion system FHA domain protein
MSARLLVTRKGPEGSFHEERLLEGAALTIGRSSDNDVVLPDEERRVSGRHARVEKREGLWYVLDLGSKNGTYVGDRRLEPHQPVALESGRTFSIEDFRFELLEETADLERTVERADPSRRAERVAEELLVLCARHAEDAPADRKDLIREALRAAVADLSPEAARAVCSQVRSRFQTAGPASVGGGAPRPEGEDFERQEAFYRAGYQVVRELSQRLLGGADFRASDEVRVFGKLIEQMVLATLRWLSLCLKGRREFENQFSAELTLLFSREQNPIKGVETSPEAIGKWLLDWSGDPDCGARSAALEAAFKDLTLHQLALLSGVQDCLREVLERLDPRAMEARIRSEARGALSRLLLKVHFEKRAWRRYVASHGELFQENSKLFNEVIYPSIRKGYLAAHAEPREPPPSEK